jgi:flavin-dependent dehydrogenase
MEYDAVVVGGGPAGSVTARFAAESGVKVIILERRTEIGVPVLCGEGISQRVDKWNMLEGTRRYFLLMELWYHFQKKWLEMKLVMLYIEIFLIKNLLAVLPDLEQI